MDLIWIMYIQNTFTTVYVHARSIFPQKIFKPSVDLQQNIGQLTIRIIAFNNNKTTLMEYRKKGRKNTLFKSTGYGWWMDKVDTPESCRLLDGNNLLFSKSSSKWVLL